MLRRLRKDQAGFTLMEIVIVIVILGILALLAVPRLIGFTDQAKIANDKEYVALIGKSAELYWASHDESFPDESDLDNNFASSEIKDLVDDPSSALQFFTDAAVITISVDELTTNDLTTYAEDANTVNVDINGNGAIDAGATYALDTGVARVRITETIDSVAYVLEYTSQYGYSALPK